MANVLLVEDDATLALSLEMTLQAHGHQVTVCRRLTEARETLSDGLPDLLYGVRRADFNGLNSGGLFIHLGQPGGLRVDAQVQRSRSDAAAQ